MQCKLKLIIKCSAMQWLGSRKEAWLSGVWKMNGCMKTLNRSRHHGVLLTVRLKADRLHNAPCLSSWMARMEIKVNISISWINDSNGGHKHLWRSKQHIDADAEMRSPLSAQATQGASSQSSDKQTALYYATLDAHICICIQMCICISYVRI